MRNKLRKLDALKEKYIAENKKRRCDMAAKKSDEEMIAWISASMRLSGHKLSYKDVENVMSGAGIVSGTIEEYLIIQRYVELMKQFNFMLEMNTEIDAKYMSFIFALLSGAKTAKIRTNKGSAFFGYGFYPSDPREIKQKISQLMNQLSDADISSEPVIRAVFLHNRILEIQPFDTKNESVAYASLCYELMRAGFPLLALDISYDEYIEYMRRSIVDEDVAGFLNLVIGTLAASMRDSIG